MNRGWAAKVRKNKKVSKLDADSPAAFNIARSSLATQGIGRKVENQEK